MDVDKTSYSTDILKEWKTFAEMRAYLGLRGYSVVLSRSFERLEKLMPELISEMREDIGNNPFTRELIAFSKKWTYGGAVTQIFRLLPRRT